MMKKNIYFVVRQVNFTCIYINDLNNSNCCYIKMFTQKVENINCSIIVVVKMFVTSVIQCLTLNRNQSLMSYAVNSIFKF